MRKDQESLFGEPLDDDVRDLIRLEHPIHTGDTAILDAEGAVVSWFVGDTDWAGEAALAYFNGLLDDAE